LQNTIEMLKKSTIKFLKDLGLNNNREWFNEHKSTYELAKKDFENFIEELITRVVKVDPTLQGITVKESVFRIYRDVRFSKDKLPYKTNFSAQFKAGGKKSPNAGYYLQVDPYSDWGSFIAGGYWMPDAPLLKLLRQEVEYNTADFKKIINATSFKKWFGELENHQLKNAPKGVDPNHPDINLLKYTSYVATHQLKTSEFTSEEILKTCVDGVKELKPLIDFLNQVHH